MASLSMSSPGQTASPSAHFQPHLNDAIVEVGQPDRHPGVGVGRYQYDDALLLVYLGETMGNAGEAQLEVGADDNLWREFLRGGERMEPLS